MTLEHLTLAEISERSLEAVRVLERHGLDYGADGDRRLGEACSASHVDLATILEELSNAGAPDLDDRDWTSAPLQDVLHFLVVTDHTFIRSELELLSRRLTVLMEESGNRYSALAHLPRVFSSLREDLETHMYYEERDVFPAIERYVAAIESGEALKGSPLAGFGGPLRVMENEHESAGAALRLMRDFANDYKIPAESSRRYRALVQGLQALEDRLLRHIYIENNALYPRAAALKPARNATGAEK